MLYASPDSPPVTLKAGAELVLKSARSGRSLSYKLESVRLIREADVIKFQGVDTINDAYRLVGLEVYCGEELMDADVPVNVIEYTVVDTGGSVWGQVSDFHKAGLNELLEITDSVSGQTLYVPYVEEIVKQIDPQTKTILIDPPEGLRALNAP